MNRIGDLRERLVLEAPTEAADGAGGVTRSFTAQATLWAAVVPVSARASFDADAPGADITHHVTIRSGVEITTRHRLRVGARLFDIVSVRAADPQGRFVLIEARERVD